jgi:hypothetical protein
MKAPKSRNPHDPELAALAKRLEASRKERERSDERLEALRQEFEIAHRRLRSLARGA